MLVSRNTEHQQRSENGPTRISASWAIALLISAACAALIATETSRVVSQRQEILAEAQKETANLASSLIQHAELTFEPPTPC